MVGAYAVVSLRTMHILFLLGASIIVDHHVTLITVSIHFYGIFVVDGLSGVLRSDGEDDIGLGLDMTERPSMVDRLGQLLNGATGSKL